MKSKLTVFRLHNPTGMSNHVMSLENAVIAQYVTGRPTVVYNAYGFDPHIWDRSHLSRLIKKEPEPPRIYDLMHVPNRDAFTFVDLELDGTQLWHKQEKRLGPIQSFYFNFSDDTSDEHHFAEGRKKFELAEYDEAPIIHFNEVNLGYYSYLLMNRPPEVDTLLASMVWRSEYLQLAERIAKHIGAFNGAHVRTTDHSHNYAVDVKRFMSGLTLLNDGTKPLVVCTDDPPVKYERSDSLIFVNDIINNEFAADFEQLPYQDNVSYGLLSMLVMRHAEDFIGTPGSTYTGLIHRAMWQKGNKNVYKTWQEDWHVHGEGPFTWNSWTSTTHPSAKMWWREWPESVLKTDLQ